jgi:hypothetical protein
MHCTQDYSLRLREAAQRELAPRMDALKENLHSLQQRLAESLNQIEEKTRDVGTLELDAAKSILAEAVDQTARRKDEELASLANFIVEIQDKEIQEEILNLYLDMAHRYSPRLVLFVVRGPNLAGWSSRGFSENAAIRVNSSSLAGDESPVLRNALDCGGSISATDVSTETALMGLFEGEALGPWHALPMSALKRPVAVLLVADSEQKKCNVEMLLAITATTQLCIENIALKILREMETRPVEEAPGQATADAEAAQSEEVKPCESAVAEVAGPIEPEVSDELTPAQPEIAESDVSCNPTEVVPQPEPIQSGSPDLGVADQKEVVSPQINLEQPTLDTPVVPIVAIEPEATSIGSGNAIALTPSEPILQAAPILSASPEKAQQLSEEEKHHADAKRFARLLVSEIKLYNERRVEDGRRNRDIYVRLKKDIDRSREMYAQRVSPSVARKVDYFHDEVLRILGDNDPSTLGSDYPGPDIAS